MMKKIYLLLCEMHLCIKYLFKAQKIGFSKANYLSDTFIMMLYMIISVLSFASFFIFSPFIIGPLFQPLAALKQDLSQRELQ